MAPINKKSEKVAKTFTVDCSAPTDNGVFDPASYVKYLVEHIKVEGHTGNLGEEISVSQEGESKVVIVSTAPFSGKYLKYLSKRYLKKNQIRDWIRFISVKKNEYALQFYSVAVDEDEEEEAEDEEMTSLPTRDLCESGEEISDDEFMEFQLNNSRYAKNETVNVIDHNLQKVAEEYKGRENGDREEINQSENGTKTNSETDAGVESDPRHSHPSDTFDTSTSDSINYDEWKEMDTQIDCGDLYDAKGESIQNVFNGKVAVSKSKSSDESNSFAFWTKSRKNHSASTVSVMNNASFADSNKSLSSFDNSRGVSRNYIRVAMEEQATKFLEMDKQFEFLFQNENDNLRKLHGSSSMSLVTAENIDGEKVNDDSDGSDTVADYDEFDDFNQPSETIIDREMTVGNQLLTTKSMLQGSQKIAYAALAKLTMVEQHIQLNEIRGSESIRVMKKMAAAQKSFTRWSMNVMEELYDHLGITSLREQQMIENLSCHGVEPGDLVKWFDSKLVVESEITEKDVQMVDIDSDFKKDSSSFNIDIRWTLICDLFLILLDSSVYDARSRTMMVNFAEYLGIKDLEVFQFERRITGALEMDEITAIVNSQKSWNERDLIKEHKEKGRGKKIVKIAFATVAGGLVIGLSAGALAPVIGAGVAAGFSTIGIGGTAGIFAGTAGTSAITAGGVLTGMRIGQKGMDNRVGSVKTFEFKPLHNNGRLNLILTVSGWMSGKMDDVRLPFSTVDPVMGDLYSLLWEPDMLTSMGQTIEILANEILTQSIQQILGVTILTTLMGAIQLPMWLSKLSYLLDNPWSVSLNRAETSGLILADTLRRSKLGVRPITLVGFSIGAKVVYTCLLDLARTGDYGIIENVYIFGAPVMIDNDSVALARSIVSGRFVNGYSKQDWILGYLFRAASGGLRSVAGLSPIDGVENVDCTSMVKGHMDYRKVMPKLLRKLGWEVISDNFVEIQEADAEATERQRKLINDFETAKTSDPKRKNTWYNKWFGKKNKEWWQMYEEGMKERAKSNEGKEEENRDDPALFDIAALREEVTKIEVESEKRGQVDQEKIGAQKEQHVREPKTPWAAPELAKNTELREFKTPKMEEYHHQHEPSRNGSVGSTGNSGGRFNFNVVDTSPAPSIEVTGSPRRTGLRPQSGFHRGSGSLDAVAEEFYTERNQKHLHIANLAIKSNGNSGSKLESKSVLGIDYDDKDEFPQDESQLKVSFT
ncbi:hypothetical protein FOA43_002606 [Brettanomyces nanus]|uniref:Uncharacterized protein n=1 Tax=Eeniella nana TaxID=13502 RepID=A0A875S1K3_EENNA|nr:uncharacterized protein FOA43_002606 [Brettanomyces nanus]QPG75256.1 hypothetical protein FOA43_002606 [Brettanomyces nanus]